jgi:phosphatidylserine/phosphatidylglycerophosphate/cardiolipin synthase-like enzyme
VAYTGGIIPSAKWVTAPGHDNGGHMHDIGIKLKGDVAVDLTRSFVQRFNSAQGECFPKKKKHLDVPLYCEKYDFKTFAQLTRSIRPQLVKERVQGEASILEIWRKAIVSARHSIYIEQQHLAHEELTQSLIEALKRGVKVIYVRPGAIECIENKKEMAELTPFLNRTKKTYERVFLDLMPQFEKEGGRMFGLFSKKFQKTIHVHSKMIIVDDAFYLIGSANFVDISFDLCDDLHTEVCVGVYDAKTAIQLRKECFKEHLGMETDLQFETFWNIGKSNSACILKHDVAGFQGQVYEMNPTAWGRNVLPHAVRIYESARQ